MPKRRKLNRKKPSIKRPKAYSKARRVVKKLNSKPSKKIVERKIKKVAKKTARKIARNSLKLSKAKISALYRGIENKTIEKMTNVELRQYIKRSLKLINASVPSMNKASRTAVKEASKIFGKGDIINTLSDKGLYKDRKVSLVEKARLAESIINGDGVSEVALIIKNMKTLKAYKSFVKGAVGINLEGIDFETYNNLISQAGRIQDVLQTHGNSETYQEIEKLYEFKDSLGFKTVGDIMINVYNENKGKGLDSEELDNLMLEALQDAVARRR